MQYLVQQDLNNAVKFANTLLRLYKKIKRLQEASFKQVSIKKIL
jgi:hypothetical protein